MKCHPDTGNRLIARCASITSSPRQFSICVSVAMHGIEPVPAFLVFRSRCRRSRRWIALFQAWNAHSELAGITGQSSQWLYVQVQFLIMPQLNISLPI